MELCIDGENLRKALKEIEEAEKNGFNFCLAVFKINGVSQALSNRKVKYSDLWERAHPTNGHLDWGRCQDVTKNNKFRNGKLIPIIGKPS